MSGRSCPRAPSSPFRPAQFRDLPLERNLGAALSLLVLARRTGCRFAGTVIPGGVPDRRPAAGQATPELLTAPGRRLPGLSGSRGRKDRVPGTGWAAAPPHLCFRQGCPSCRLRGALLSFRALHTPLLVGASTRVDLATGDAQDLGAVVRRPGD